MPTANDFDPALDARDADMIKAALVKRVIYAIADDEDPSDLIALTDGQVPVGLGFDGGIFWLDPDDTSSPHDGVTTIVTSDGYRYHMSDFVPPHSVLGVNVTNPPGSPSIGDAYMTSPAPTGAWAGHGEEIAVYTTRGWVFVEPKLGMLIYVADGTERWVYLDSEGDIRLRFDYQDATIPDEALIGGQRRYIVESTEVNSPPGSPGLGIYWIVGESPTGAWSGNTGLIATSYDGSSWTFITPTTGVEAYDRVTGRTLIYRTGIGWVPASGAWANVYHWQDPDLRYIVNTRVVNYTGWPAALPPVSDTRFDDDETHSYTAAGLGAKLRFSVSGAGGIENSSATGDGQTTMFIGLFRDAESTAIAVAHVGIWFIRDPAITAPYFVPFNVTMTVDAPDGSPHTYKLGYATLAGGAVGTYVALAGQEIYIEEMS